MAANATNATLALALTATAVLSAVGAVAAWATLTRGRRRGGGGGGGGAKGALTGLARDNITELTPYRCARDDYSEGVLLDANENSYGPTLQGDSIELDLRDLELNRYPDPYQNRVKALLAELRGVSPRNIFVGVGSDEAIDLIIRIFCAPGRDAILITPPTYGMYKVCAKVNDVAIQQAPLTPSFEVDMTCLRAAIRPNTKIVFLCSPGNPTAKTIPLDIVRQVHACFPGIVVVDEAYIDFAESPSATQLVGELDRVVVMQVGQAVGLLLRFRVSPKLSFRPSARPSEWLLSVWVWPTATKMSFSS
jgi:histidinol-phosphate aminotransferase